MGDARLLSGQGGGDPAMELSGALEVALRGADQLRAALEVEWDTPAARLYRAEVGEATRALARDLSLLEEAVRCATGYLAVGGNG